MSWLNPFSSSAPKQLMLIFIHGFQGSEKTFASLPEDLATALSSQFTITHTKFVYASRGNNQPLDLHNFIQSSSSPQDRVILISHSMGGIVAFDSLKEGAPLPQVCGILALDTPFFGLDVNNHDYATKPIVDVISKASSSGWGGLALGFAGAALAVGAGVHLMNRANSGSQMDSYLNAAKSHLSDTSSFLGPLWNVGDQATRFSILRSKPPAFFHGLYLEIATEAGERKRFCNLPPPDFVHLFSPVPMRGALHPVDCHMNMFEENQEWYFRMLQLCESRIVAMASSI